MINEDKYINISFEILKYNVKVILNNNIPVWRKNKSGEYVVIPLENLEQFFGNNDNVDLILYITEEWESLIDTGSINARKEAIIRQNIWSVSGPEYYEQKRLDIKNMTPAERDKEFKSVIQSIQKIKTTDKVLNEDLLVNLIEAVSDAFVLTKASFEDNYSDDKKLSHEHIKSMAKNTTSLVHTIMGILKKNSPTGDFVNMLREKSSGSTIAHMDSVFFTFLTFCYFYNSQFAIGKITKLRGEYKKKYYRYYKKLIPDNPPESLEDVFNGGMQEIPLDKLLQFSIGAFLHDIGKIDNIDYFEGTGFQNKKIIMEHAPIGYNMILKTNEFDSEVPLLAALHHEYYNDESGYGISRFLFPESSRKYKSPQYCMTYDLADLKNGRALSYVPIKILEIIDVFEALTEKGRKYRDKEYSIEEAVELMKSDFINKKLKIDPLLFTIFLDYIDNHSVLNHKILVKSLML